jgi:hypothetical protein
MTGNLLKNESLSILLRSNRPRLHEETLKISRGVFLAVRVDENVPSTLVG